MALDQLIDRRRGRQPDLARRADDRRILEHQFAQFEIGPLADQDEYLTPGGAIGSLGKAGKQGAADQRRIVGRRQGGVFPFAIRVDDRRVEGDGQLDLGLHEGRVALRDDAEKKDGQKAESDDDRRDPVGAEALFDRIAPRQAGVRPFRQSPTS